MSEEEKKMREILPQLSEEATELVYMYALELYEKQQRGEEDQEAKPLTMADYKAITERLRKKLGREPEKAEIAAASYSLGAERVKA